MQRFGVYSWNIDIVETQCSWIFIGIAEADDPLDVAWRSSGRMLYCLDSRLFHRGSGSTHPAGDCRISSGDSVRVVLDCTGRTLAFGVNGERPTVLFRDLDPVAYVPAVDLRDCGDKISIASSVPTRMQRQQSAKSSMGMASRCQGRDPEAVSVPPQSRPSGEAVNAASQSGSTTEDPPAVTPPSEGQGGDPGPRAPLVSEGGQARRPPVLPEAHPVQLPHPPHVGIAGSSLTGGGHPHTSAGGSNARMSQPRQSQGSQGAASAAALFAQDRSLSSSGSATLEPLSWLEEDRDASWDQPEVEPVARTPSACAL